MNLTLLRRELKANYKILLLFMTILSMYAAMITAMFDPKLGNSLNAMRERMPEIFAAAGMANRGTTLARYIDGGSMACLLPARISIFFAGGIFRFDAFTVSVNHLQWFTLFVRLYTLFNSPQG